MIFMLAGGQTYAESKLPISSAWNCCRSVTRSAAFILRIRVVAVPISVTGSITALGSETEEGRDE
jgi:hypothetical protein